MYSLDSITKALTQCQYPAEAACHVATLAYSAEVKAGVHCTVPPMYLCVEEVGPGEMGAMPSSGFPASFCLVALT